MKATCNLTHRLIWFALGLTFTPLLFVFSVRSLRMLPDEMFPSFALFSCFLAAMAGASCRTVWAGIAQGSAYALILRWLFGTYFPASTVMPGQSICCILPLLAAFWAALAFHRATNAFCGRQKPFTTNLLSACRKFCLLLACVYAALAATSRPHIDVRATYYAPLPIIHAPAFTSPESYFTEPRSR